MSGQPCNREGGNRYVNEYVAISISLLQKERICRANDIGFRAVVG